MERMIPASQSISTKLGQRKGVIVIAILVALALTYGVLLTRPFEYQATVQLLIIQKQADDQDLLSALRATEQVGKSLTDVIYTSTFFEKVLNSDYPIKKKFSDRPEQRREEWRKAVRTSVAQQSGIITVMVYDTDKEQAAVLARSIAHILTDESQEFHGKSNIIVKVVDDVYTKRWPVKPNLVGSTLAAIFFGSLAGIALVAILPSFRPKREQRPAMHIPHDRPSSAKPVSPFHTLAGRPDADGYVQQGNPPAGLPVDGEEDDV